MQKAIRGNVYQFLDKDLADTGKRCIVISSNHRQADKLVSIIMLGSREGVDSVPIALPTGLMYAHCGLTTYCDRKRLGARVTTLEEDTMKEIDKGILTALGITDYEDMYNMILDKMMNQKEAK